MGNTIVYVAERPCKDGSQKYFAAFLSDKTSVVSKLCLTKRAALEDAIQLMEDRGCIDDLFPEGLVSYSSG